VPAKNNAHPREDDVPTSIEDQVLIVCFAVLMAVWLWVKSRDE